MYKVVRLVTVGIMFVVIVPPGEGAKSAKIFGAGGPGKKIIFWYFSHRADSG